MLLSLLDKMDKKLEAVFDCAYRRLWLEVAKATAHRWPSTSPRLEALEDRLAPAAFTFTGLDPNDGTAWSHPQNWSVNGGGNPNNLLPGADDSVSIPAPLVCNVDIAAGVDDLSVTGTLNTTPARWI